MRTMLKKSIVPAALVFLSVIISLLLAEGLIRLFFPQNLYSFEKGLFIKSDDYGYSLTPNVEKKHSQPEYSYIIRSNSFGFRGKEPDFNADYRVLILGDSMGMGQGVGEGKNLADLAQVYLNKQRYNIDIFNTSIAGYFGFNELKVLSKFINTYKPNSVVLLFLWNDIGMYESLSVSNGYLVLNDRVKMGHIREWLNNNSQLFCLIKKFYYVNIKKNGNINVNIINEADMNIALNYITEMKKLCDKHNVFFSVVLLPHNTTSNKESDDFMKSKAILMRKLKENSIKYVDWAKLLPEDNLDKLVFKFDKHWTEYGHKYFSGLLTDHISDIYLTGKGR
ncbi:MAG: hypothetical protein A2Y97_04140 [Nitrospirae bacterium RBG_13_39_12]|nr:MAG: hypothetical protein A2Y97_04140 [Nitrospirae bacterium RBG_13_39_12]